MEADVFLAERTKENFKRNSLGAGCIISIVSYPVL
jgi:hypothetical protein